ncbi:MAG: PLP-dependent aminotransferase family protein [Vulcanimicrobiota bacterium]
MTPYLRIHVPGQTTALSIAESIAGQLERGRLPDGGRLPPVRVLAHQLGVSKNTVQAGYDELAARGLAESLHRRGVFLVKSPERAGQAALIEPSMPQLMPHRLRPYPGPELLNLSTVFIDPELLPVEQLTACYRAVLAREGLPVGYQAQGYLPLREAIAERLRQRGIAVETDEVIVTVGSQQALDVTCRALAHKSVATENPAYAIGKRLFEMNQMQVYGLPLDPFDGPDLEVWRRELKKHRPGLLYLTSNFQNPTGYSYTTSELLELAELSAELGFGIIEDDWGSDMLSFSEFRPPLRALAGPGILYINSFTKKLLPSLRIGYLVAHRSLVPTLVEAKRAASLGNPLLEEMALCEFLQRGYYDTHLRKLQVELDRRYQNCLELLDELMPEGCRWGRPGGGPLVWLELPRSVDFATLEARLGEQGVCLRNDPEHFFGEPHLHGFPIGFAHLAPERLEQGLRVLAAGLTR